MVLPLKSPRRACSLRVAHAPCQARTCARGASTSKARPRRRRGCQCQLASVQLNLRASRRRPGVRKSSSTTPTRCTRHGTLGSVKSSPQEYQLHCRPPTAAGRAPESRTKKRVSDRGEMAALSFHVVRRDTVAVRVRGLLQQKTCLCLHAVHWFWFIS